MEECGEALESTAEGRGRDGEVVVRVVCCRVRVGSAAILLNVLWKFRDQERASERFSVNEVKGGNMLTSPYSFSFGNCSVPYRWHKTRQLSSRSNSLKPTAYTHHEEEMLAEVCQSRPVLRIAQVAHAHAQTRGGLVCIRIADQDSLKIVRESDYAV